MRLTIGASMILAGSLASACTIVFAARSGHVLVAGNEDESNQPQFASHYIRFEPADKSTGTLGYVAFGYKSNPFSDESAMNEAGLFYDFDALDKLDTPREGKPKGAFNSVNKMLQTCRTVAEAVKFLESYDLPQMSSAQMLVGDATGASAIIERQATTWRSKKRDFQIGTNFRTSTTPEAQITCERYSLCRKTLTSTKSLTLKDMANMLRQTAAANKDVQTWYSIVCDLKSRNVYLSVRGDFAKTVEFNLTTELAKGSRRLDMEAFVSSSSQYLDWSHQKSRN